MTEERKDHHNKNPYCWGKDGLIIRHVDTKTELGGIPLWRHVEARLSSEKAHCGDTRRHTVVARRDYALENITQ